MFKSIQSLDLADTLLLIVFPAIAILCWLIVIIVFVRGKNPLPLMQRAEVPWGLLDVLILFGSMWISKLVAQVIAMVLIASREGLPIDKVTEDIAMRNVDLLVGCTVVIAILQLVAVVLWLQKFHSASLADIGLNWNRLRQDICIGIVASVLIIPLILLLNLAIHIFLREQYNHQVMVMVKQSVWLTGFSTVVVTPFVEELHFRAFIQGWMERIFGLDATKKMRVVHGDKRTEKMLGDSARKKQTRPITSKVPIWPIFASALIFAAMHAGQGAAPYALFAFAICLGFLYRQTHSVVSCIVVHLVLNLWSYTALVSGLE